MLQQHGDLKDHDESGRKTKLNGSLRANQGMIDFIVDTICPTRSDPTFRIPATLQSTRDALYLHAL